MARFHRVLGAMGAITSLFSLTFLLPLLVALAYDPYDVVMWRLRLPAGAFLFAACALGVLALGVVMQRIAASAPAEELRDRDAYLTVALGWLWLCAIGMLPFIVSNVLPDPVDAFFETMSAMTTTGATVIGTSLDEVTPSIMAWRAFLQFLGGMGIVVLSVALLARLTQGGLQMLEAEAPGPSIARIAPRLAETARILWKIYLAMTGVLFLLLLGAIGRLGFDAKTTFYEAMIHTFTTISTGGFSNHDASIAYFHDGLVETIIVVFMLLAATNFTLQYQLFKERRGTLWRDPEWRFFLTTYVVATLVMTALLWSQAGVGGFRAAAFTAASLITSTGFATADFGQWPEAAKFVILLLMVTGGTAGSTAGGMKHVRVLILLKLVRREVTRMQHPKAVLPVRLNRRVIQPTTLMATVGFVVAFVVVWAFGAVVLMVEDTHFRNPVDAASASISALSNMGPGLGVVGPSHTYAGLNHASKLTLAFEMWFGRLEIFTAMLLFTPKLWRH